MEREFIPYEQAFEIRQLGFNEQCLGEWQNTKSGKYLVVDDEYDRKYDIPVLGADIGALLYQQAFRWFREKYNILATIYSNASGYLYEWHDAVGGTHRGWSEYEGLNDGGVWDTYEEAELACLKKLIEIVKNK